MLYGEKPTGLSVLPANAVRPKPERSDTIKPLSAFSRAMPGMHDRLPTGPKPVQDTLKPQFGGPTPNRVKTQTIKLPSKTAADPKAAAKPTANASVGGFSLTPSIKLPSVGSFAPASAAFALDYQRTPTSLPGSVAGELSREDRLPSVMPAAVRPAWIGDARYGKLPPMGSRPAHDRPMRAGITTPDRLRSEDDPWPERRNASLTSLTEKKPGSRRGFLVGRSAQTRHITVEIQPSSRAAPSRDAVDQVDRADEHQIDARRCVRLFAWIVGAPDTRMLFQQGGVGSPRKQLPRKRIPADLRSLARGHTDLSIKSLAGIAQNGQSEMARVATYVRAVGSRLGQGTAGTHCRERRRLDPRGDPAHRYRSRQAAGGEGDRRDARAT